MPTKKITLPVNGIDCAQCGETLCADIMKTANIKDVRFSVMASEIELDLNGNALDLPSIERIISRHGGRLVQQRTASSTEKVIQLERHLLTISGIFCLVGIASEFILRELSFLPLLFYAIAIITGIVFTAKKAWAAVRVFSLDMHVLMCIAVTGAVGIGEWNEAAMVVFLFSLSNLLESHSVDRARNAITKLMQLSPEIATVKRGNEFFSVKIEEIELEEILLVRPGERIPLDGTVIDGTSHIDQSPITGESLPVEKKKDDQVFAGTINGYGVLEIRINCISSETTLARIIKLVREASNNKAPAQRFVDSFAKIYTPIVVLLAITIAIIPPLVFGHWGEWFYRSLVMLIIACPCALVISTPVTIISGLTRAARNGLLIKGGSFLELAGQIDFVVFDKTGTLTKGEPELKEIRSLSALKFDKLLAIAGGLEQKSEHHLGKAILRKAEENHVSLLSANFVQTIPGKGITGVVQGERVNIGNRRFLNETHPQSALSQLPEQNESAFYMWNDEQILAKFVIEDAVRDESRNTIATLKELGVEKIAMLTGDQGAIAQKIAKDLDLDLVYSELLPQDKLEILQRLTENTRGKSAMVGDGINDAPCLAAADIGISMGKNGTDIALEAADIVVMNDNLMKIPELIRLSRRVMRIVRQNITAALLIKVLFTALIIPGVATLWMAVLADVGTSLMVIMNGMRALKQKSM